MAEIKTHSVVRFNSHRAYEKLSRLLAPMPLDNRWTPEYGSRFIVIPSERLDEALAITGITRTRVKIENLYHCWKM
jgi:hypothetical protein